MSNALAGTLISLAAVVFLGSLFFRSMREDHRRARRARRVEQALEMALGKILRGEISGSDKEWARLVQRRLWEDRREE